MKKTIRFLKILKANKVISGSLIMVVGGFLGSFTNYLYHLSMARLLGPKDYGILESLISVIYQLSIPLTTISFVIIKYVSYFKGQNRTKTIQSFFWKVNKKILIFIPFIIIIIFISAPFISNFLHFPSSILVILVGMSFVFSIFVTLGRSFLQGLSKFFLVSITGLLDGIFRLLTALILVLLGLGLFGSVFSFFLTSIFSVSITLYLVRNLIKGNRNEPIPEKKEMFRFIFPVFFTNLAITSLVTSDIILVRHFFPSFEAGLYSALSTLGKIVFFAASPVITVILPMVSEAQAANKNFKKTALSGLLLIGLIIAGSLFVLGFFPQIMVIVLFGEKYLAMAPLVIYFSVAIAIYTINVALLNIFLALKITLPTIFVSITALLQIIMIVFFHQSLGNIINIFIVLSSLLLLSLLLYYALSSSLIKLKIGRQNSSPL